MQNSKQIVKQYFWKDELFIVVGENYHLHFNSFFVIGVKILRKTTTT